MLSAAATCAGAAFFTGKSGTCTTCADTVAESAMTAAADTDFRVFIALSFPKESPARLDGETRFNALKFMKIISKNKQLKMINPARLDKFDIFYFYKTIY